MQVEVHIHPVGEPRQLDGVIGGPDALDPIRRRDTYKEGQPLTATCARLSRERVRTGQRQAPWRNLLAVARGDMLSNRVPHLVLTCKDPQDWRAPLK